MSLALPVVSDSLTLYLAEIKRFPVLSQEEEHRLAVRLFEDKDLDAAQKLITSNLRFVVKIAYEYHEYGMKMLDLIQEGNIGLMMAVKKFNPYKGIRLISYAVWWIRAYIQNHILSAWSLLKIGTTQAQRKLFFKLNQAKKAIRNLTGMDDDSAAAESLHVKEEEVTEMTQRMMGEFSLDAEIVGGDGGTLLDNLADTRQNQEELLADVQHNEMLHEKIAAAMENLNEKEKYVILHRVTAETPLTLQEIADHFSVSRERIRQIEEGALKKMKNLLQPLVAQFAS